MNKYQEALKWVKSIHDVIGQEEYYQDLGLRFGQGLHESIETIKELVDKETPMKPKYISLLTNPPKHKVVCSNFHGPYLERVFKFCPSCGQKIDWGYENDLETVKELVNKEKRE